MVCGPIIRKAAESCWTASILSDLKFSLSRGRGLEVPNPLTVEINRGGADIEVVLCDILGLTKLNFKLVHIRGRKSDHAQVRGRYRRGAHSRAGKGRPAAAVSVLYL